MRRVSAPALGGLLALILVCIGHAVPGSAADLLRLAAFQPPPPIEFFSWLRQLFTSLMAILILLTGLLALILVFRVQAAWRRKKEDN